MHVIIKTDRLLLRTFTENDAQIIYELNLDPEVIKFTHDAITDLDHAKTILREVILPQYALNNFGRWAVHLRHNLKFIGWCGLKYRAGRNEVDLGYRFMKKYWGNGYATEAAFSCIKYGFEKLNLPVITGRSEPGNFASINVLEKSGMVFENFDIMDGYKVRTYRIYNSIHQP